MNASANVNERYWILWAGLIVIASSWNGFAADRPVIVVEETRVISWKPPLYHGWPTVTQRRDGELLVAFSGGREAHVCPFGRLELMRSKDEGKTWGWPQVILDCPIDDRDAGIVETPRGSLLITNFTSLAYADLYDKAMTLEPGQPGAWDRVKITEWTAAHLRLSPEQRQQELGLWMLRSEDGGVNWSARYHVPCNSPHGPIALNDGRMLYCGIDLWGNDRTVGAWESKDDGLTWTLLGSIPARPGDESRNYHELHAVECRSGKLIAQIRNHNSQNRMELLQSESNDGGRHWTEPRSTGIWGLPSHLVRLRDHRILVTYGYRRAPFGIQARVSSDEGASWSEPLSISDDGNSPDLGHPSTVECRDGSFVTVWYELLKDSEFAQLRQARWRLK